MTINDPTAQSVTTSAADEDLTHLLADEIVRKHLAQLSELEKDLSDDLDQLGADLDDNRLAIAASVAWLIGDNGRRMQETSTLLRARLTYLAGLNLFPLQWDE